MLLPIVIFLVLGVPTAQCWAGTSFPHRKSSYPQTHHHLLTLNMMASSTASHEMELWLDLRRQAAAAGAGDDAVAIAPSILDSLDGLIFSDDHQANIIIPTRIKEYVIKTDPNNSNNPPKIFRNSHGSKEPIGAIIDVSTPSGQDMALGLIGSVEWIVITCQEDKEDGWIMIPAENLISSCQGTGTKIAAIVNSAGEVGGLSRALELGIDALCVDSVDAIENEDLWSAVIDAKIERHESTLTAANNGSGDDLTIPAGPTIVQGTCKRVAPTGGKSTVLADRVCIDLVQSLKSTEGCWIGSSAKIMVLVLSEAAQSSFVPSRPFRVNAGPVHSYVVMGDGKSTKYLSELCAGDEVLVYDVVSGSERSVAVGRLKVEVRPCVQVGLFAPQNSKLQQQITEDVEESQQGQVFLQQAETVRLGQTLGDGAFLRITDLDYGENTEMLNVLLRVVSFGTHVGKAYSGTVTEK